jgi:hypothetical protein
MNKNQLFNHVLHVYLKVQEERLIFFENKLKYLDNGRCTEKKERRSKKWFTSSIYNHVIRCT